ncbi:MAG: GTPase HflX [Candidatus Brocadiaceae bacterium]|jgi:GTP-binding protein HflX
MAEPRRTDLALRAEQAVLVQVISRRNDLDADETFEELESLAHTARTRIVGRLRQRRDHPHRTHYLGTGKLKELRRLCRSTDANVVICDDELSPAQVKTLEGELDTKVVDRSEVILDIFASHARTKQAKLQVELAQLEYELPRLTRRWTHLDRTAGGTLGGPVGGGIGVRGPGEKQLEVDRRLVQRRIHELKKSLEKIEKRRHVMVEDRNQRFTTVALVGYTNAGKSSLMNALTGSGVSVRDRLFETLDTRTRDWELPDGREVLLSDTVGFIRKFPHHLVATFHATLEEAREADLLLHVIDAAKPDPEREVRSVNEALAEVGCADRPAIYLLNKTDLVQDYSGIPLVRKLVDEVICTSARTGTGLEEVARRVCELLDRSLTEYRVEAGLGNGRLDSFLYERGQVRDRSCRDGRLQYRVLIDPESVGIIRSLGGEVEKVEARTEAE